jgi:hypothetical protein
MTTDEKERLKQLEQANRELQRAKDILSWDSASLVHAKSPVIIGGEHHMNSISNV